MDELVVGSTESTLPGKCRRLGRPHPESPDNTGSLSKGRYVQACVEPVDDRALVDLAIHTL
ncbi:hypothetical protein ABZ817_38365 [Streptomyces antimycoticus]|uniref:hypothetical protein n=1 Tax=Streptomyces antimycoticus TaxID=68175 RepID=UPI0033E562F5